jgi:hypothetical protein
MTQGGSALLVALVRVADALAAHMQRREAEELRRRREAKKRSPLFVRFGAPPPSGISAGWSPRFGRPEAGVSVFRAHRNLKGDYVVDVSEGKWLAVTASMLAREGRPVYLATGGREVGAGSDGEPVLRGAEFEPLPEGAQVRISEHWREFAERWAGLVAPTQGEREERMA